VEQGRADSQRRLELEIATLRHRLEDAEEMRRAITGGHVDGFVIGQSDDDQRIALLDLALPHYGQILHRIQQGATTVSRTGQILYANQRFAALLGESLGNLFSASLHQYVAPPDQEPVERFLQAGAPDSTLDLILSRRNGELVAARLTLVSFGDGYASLLVTDVSSSDGLTEAEGALEAIRSGQIDGVVVGGEEIVLLGTAHHSYRAMVDRMQQGAVTVSSDGEVLYANDRFATMIGVPGENILGKVIDSWFVPSQRDRLRQLLAQSAASGAQVELDIVGREGDALPVLVTGAPADASGTVTLVITDLREERRHREIEEEGRRKDEFLAVLAHELRNPLAPIRNAVQVLQWMPELAPAAMQAVGIIARQSATLTRLLDDLLDINRLNQGKITLHKSVLDLRTVISNAVEAVQPLAQARRHTLETDLPARDVLVQGDAVRLAQVIVNLLSNAAKYTPQGGRISIHLRPEAPENTVPRAVVRVTDSGIGIPVPALRTIFEPYAQLLDSSEAVPGGLGLGLTVARRLVELHGGTIEARSAGSGQGSEFIVELPIAHVCASRPAADEASTGARVSPRGMRILVADDNPDSVQSLAMLLTLAGHETRSASDGAEAIRVADEFRPDVAFLDIGMPNMDGYATARELRTRPWAQHLMLFALTGWGQPDDKVRARLAGFDAHVVKPLDFRSVEELIAGVRSDNPIPTARAPAAANQESTGRP
jgi:PAS domain S-box-containing protein